MLRIQQTVGLRITENSMLFSCGSPVKELYVVAVSSMQEAMKRLNWLAPDYDTIGSRARGLQRHGWLTASLEIF